MRAMGLCRPGGRYMIAMLWLENRTYARRVHIFRKVRAALSGASLFHACINSRRAGTYSRIVHEHIDPGSFLNYAHPSIVYDVP